MKANEAPEKIFIEPNLDSMWGMAERSCESEIEYTRTDAFIEKALKWYCRDCECNDNCKDTKCFFYEEYERYLKGDTDAIPPKLSHCILNEDGSTSDDYSYRHFIKRMQDAFIEKACDWIEKNIAEATGIDSYVITDSFKQAMKK